MPTLVAAIPTSNAVRYVTQLGKHAVAMAGRVPLRVEQTAERTRLTFDRWGTCTAGAEDGRVVLRIDAADEEGAQCVQDVVTRDIQRFGRREGLAVVWRRTDHDRAEPEQAAAARGRSPAARMVAAAGLGVVLVVVLHVGLGGAVVAGWGWLGWSVVGGLTVAGLALLSAHLAVPVLAVRFRHRLVRRGDDR